jgi:hypothetical protein
MKKIISIILLLAFVLTFNRCSEEAYEEKFADPTKSATFDFDKLMAGTLLYSREWCMSGYGRFFGWESQVLMKQANTVGLTLDAGVFYALEGYTDGMPPLGEFSKMVSSYKQLESAYAQMSDADKDANEAYLLAAETQLLAGLAYMLPIFGSIAYDEIGGVATTGDVSLASPHYQDDQELFEMILNRLGQIAPRFAAITSPPALMKVQDFINKGDMDKWVRYTNSIRLKTALLVSTQGALAAKGQAVIKEILDGNLPIVETNAQNIVMAQSTKSGSALDINGGSGFDWVNQRMAGLEMINRMQKAGDGGVWVDGQDDPRLPIMFCLATVNGEFAVLTPEEEVVAVPPALPKEGKAIPTVFRGSSAGMDYNVWEEYLSPSATRAYFSYIRPNGFFKDNRNWDNPIITCAEINFIKAEAYLKGWASGDAKAAFKAGVKASIQEYFKYQGNRSSTEEQITTGSSSTSFSFKAVINPDQAIYNDAWIDAFAEARWTSKIDGSAYTEQLEAILEQKWLNYGYMYANEQWTDLRRTGYPKMYYQKDRDIMATVPYPINRNRYPESERNNNVNFSKEVGSHDNWSEVLFWAKANWHDGPTW